MAQSVLGLLLLTAAVLMGRFGLASRWLWLGLGWLAVLVWLIGWRMKGSERFRPAGWLLIGVCVVAVGWRAAVVLPRLHQDAALVMSEQRLVIDGLVVEPPRQTARSRQIIIETSGVAKDSNQPIARLIQVTLPLHTQVDYGDQLELQGVVQGLSETDPGYASYLSSKGVYGTMVWPNLSLMGSTPPSRLINWGWQSQRYLAEQVNRLLPQDEGAFLLGVVLGAKLPLSEKFDQSLRTTGTSHIVVASGYNISVVLAIVLSLMRKVSRLAVYGLAVLAVGGYVLLSGVDPSIVRAAIMGVLSLIALAAGRQKLASQLLFVSAAVMLAIQPSWLFQLGFQLSFMATLGLILLEPMISDMLRGWLPKSIEEVTASTLAAQFFVYPLIIASFGQASVVSLLTNILVLWLTPWLMVGGLVLVALSGIWLAGAYWLAMLVYPWLWYVKAIIELTGSWSWSSLGVEVEGAWLVTYYIGLGLVVLWHGRRRQLLPDKANADLAWSADWRAGG